MKHDIPLTVLAAVLTLGTLGSFSIHDGNGNDNATNEEFDWSSEEK